MKQIFPPFRCISVIILIVLFIPNTTYSRSKKNFADSTIRVSGLLPPAAITPAGPVSFCASGYLVVTGYAFGSSFQWKKDGNNFGPNNDSLLVNTSATYTCIVTENGNTTTLNNVVVTINPLPNVIVSANDNSICAGGFATLTANGANTYSWLPSTGLSSTTGSTVTATPASTTTYTVTGTGNNNCTDTASVKIILNPKPIASFTYSPNSGCPRRRRRIYFNSTSLSNGSGNISYNWNFGDPNSSSNISTDNNPDHSFVGSGFGSAGTYNVTLTVTGANGCSNSSTQIISIGEFPDATLTSSAPTIQLNGETYFKACDSGSTAIFSFLNLSTTPSTNTNYQINWGDNSPNYNSTNFNTIITHNYSIGIYTLSFIVTGGASSCKDSSTYNIFVGSNPAVSFGNPGNTLICSNSSLTFPITGVSSNPPGTTYTVTFNDGSTPISYTHPPPTSITHIFSNTSCGTVSSNGTNNYNNSFSTNIEASNPCGVSSVGVVPIYVSSKPVASFTISPYDTICQNTLITLTNTSIGGNSISSGLSLGNCGSPTVVWSISPSTGFTVTSGTMGNDNGSNSPNFWVPAGTNSLGVNFTTPGVYRIRLKVGGSGLCAIDSFIKTICVNPIPTASFILTPNIGCAPLRVVANGSTNTATCGQNTYQWGVSYTSTSGCEPASSDYAYVDGTNSNSQNPHFNFVNPGVYTISLQTFAPHNRCSSNVVTNTVTVKAKPVVNLFGIPTSLCQNIPISPSANATCYIDNTTTYAWTFSNATPATSSQASPGAIQFNSSGNQTVGLTVTNSCGPTLSQQSINVIPIPTITSISNIVKCKGENIAPISFSGTSGASYTWTNDNTNIGLSASGTGNILAFTAQNSTNAPIVATIQVTPSKDGCPGLPITFTITVNPLPSVSVTPTSASICSGSTGTTLTASGTADTYSWTSTSGMTPTTGVTYTANPTTNTTYTVTGNITATGCKNTATSTITVNPSPVITAGSSTNPNNCTSPNGSFTILGLTSNITYSVSYNFNGTPQTAINTNSNGSGEITISNLPAGNYTNIRVTLNACPSNALSFSLIPPSAPNAPSVTAILPICSGNSISLSVVSPASTGTYTWSGPAFPSGANGSTVTINNASTNLAGVYSVIYTLNNCASNPTNITVIVDSTPVKPVAGSNSPICSDSTIKLTASTTSTMAVTWLWSGPSSYSSTQQNPTIPIATSLSNGGNYSVTATATYPAVGTVPQHTCQSTSSPVTVVVNTTPKITGSSFTNPTNCASSTGTIVLNGLENSTAYDVHYTVNSTPRVLSSISSNGSGVLTIPSLPQGTYSDVYVVLSGCPSGKVGPFVLADPNPPAAPTASVTTSPTCSGQSINLNASTTASGTASYSWSGPLAYTSTQQNPTITAATTGMSGTYSVTLTINACTSSPTNVSVIVDSTPVIPVAISNSPVCSDSTIKLTASTSSTMAVTWLWSGPSSYSSTLQNPTIPNATSSNGGSYSVTATATYPAVGSVPQHTCQSSSLPITVVINTTPRITSSSFTNPTNCASSTGTIVLNGLENSTSYEVHYIVNSTPRVISSINSNGSGVLTIPSLPQGTYSDVYVVLSGCPSGKVGPFVLVDPNPPAAPTASVTTSPICSGQSINLNASTTASGTASYSWSGPLAYTSTQQNPTITAATTGMSGTYSVTLTINSCTSSPTNVSVIVDSTPVIPVAISNSPVCSDSTIKLTASTTSTMAVTWLWSGPSSYSSTQQNPTIPNATSFNGGSYSVTATATYPAVGSVPQRTCKSTSSPITVVINTTPRITSSSFTNPTNCASSTGTIVLNGLENNTSYEVHYIVNSTPRVISSINSNGSGVLTIPSLPQGTYSDVYVVLSGCPSGKVGPFVLVDPNPPAAPVANPVSAICLNEQLLITINTPITNGVYNWSGPNGFNQSSGSSVTINNAQLTDSGDYHVTVTLNSCTSNSTTIPFTVYPRPVNPIVTSPVVYCQKEIPVALLATALPNHRLSWYTTAAGGTASATAPTPSTTNAGNTTYYVSQTNIATNCEGPRDSILVRVKPTPDVPNLDTTVCSGANFTLNPSGAGIPVGTLYSWPIPTINPIGLTGEQSGINQTNFSGSLNDTTDFIRTAVYRVSPISGVCKGDSFSITIHVNPAPHLKFSIADQNICSGSTSASVTLSSVTPGVTIPWVSITPTGISGASTSGTDIINAQNLVNNTNQTINLTFSAVAITSGTNGCPGDTSRYHITVYPTPQITLAPIIICSRDSIKLAPQNNPSTLIVPAGTTYTWTYDPAPNISGQTNQTIGLDTIRQGLVNLTDVPQTITYHITPSAGTTPNCPGTPFTLIVTVNPIPEIPTLTDTICSEKSFSIIPVTSVSQSLPDTIVPAGTRYTWNIPTLPPLVTGAVARNNESSIFGTLYNTGLVAQTVTYIVTPVSGTNGNCPGQPFNVEITVNPLASISNNPLYQSVCNGGNSSAIVFTSLTTSGVVAYSWKQVGTTSVTGFDPIGNGNLPVMNNLVNNGIAQDSVVYEVTSTSTACAGHPAKYTIYVNPDAKANFTFPKDTACWPFDILINNSSPQSAGNIDIPNSRYDWYGTDSALNTTFIGSGYNFPRPPGYIIPDESDSAVIKMVAISYFGCKSDSVLHTFFTKPKPKALFAMSNKDSCGPLTVVFTNQTNFVDTFQYQWNFGNGQTSTLAHPNPVTFLSNLQFHDTTYYISMKAFNECDSSFYHDSVIVRANAKARFSANHTSGCSPYAVQFINSSLGNAYDYYWDFDNGHKDTTHVNDTLDYTFVTYVVDTFNVRLIAQNNCGRDTQIIKIRVAPNSIVPGVTINANELFGCAAHTVNFVNTTSGATSFTWDFGDHSPLQYTNFFEMVVPHTFVSAGTFPVTVYMTNGCSYDTTYDTITVYPKPIAAFTPDKFNYCLGDSTHVINNSQFATNYIWNWDITQTVTTNGFEPSHLYTAPGNYTIKLIAEKSNANGIVCYDETTQPVTVLNKPDSTIITNINSINCTPYIFTASAPGVTTENVTWYVYDTSVSLTSPIILTGSTLQYTFNNEGAYEVKMLVENAAGCKDSTKRRFTIYRRPTAGFTPLNLSTCNLDTIVNYTNTSYANYYTPISSSFFVDGVPQPVTGVFNHHFITASSTPLPRIFNTMLVATNIVGCTDTARGTVQMNPTATASFTLTNPTACIPFVANIIQNSTYATNYQWYLNGVLVSIDRNPTINITAANTNYTIKLVVSNSYACRPDVAIFTFRTRVIPIAIFTVDDSLGCVGYLNVVTHNQSLNANAYVWQWGDTSPDNYTTNPTHLFTNLGQYRIFLIAKDGVCQDTMSKVVNVALKPIVDFSGDNQLTCDTASVLFTNLTTNATNFLWQFSGNAIPKTSTLINPSVAFPPSNTPYTIKLIASNTAGCKDSLSKPNYIRAIIPPYSDFYINPSPTILIPNYTFSFTNLTPNSILYQYSWSFGDSTYASTRDIDSHFYHDTGSYPIRLIVLDTSTNCLDTTIKIARIEGYPGYLYVPNAFYPNSIQPKFKSFKPLGKGLAQYELQVFDSWGTLLFRSTLLDAAGAPVEGWDGTLKGKPMPQDGYAWRIKAKFRNGNEWNGMIYNQSDSGAPGHTFGTVTLFR